MDATFNFTSKERYGVTSLSFIVINNNTGDSQIETQLHKNKKCKQMYKYHNYSSYLL